MKKSISILAALAIALSPVAAFSQEPDEPLPNPEPEVIEVTAVQPPNTLARDLSFGIGLAGLGVGVLSSSVMLDSADTGGMVFGLITLGVGVVGLTTAGLIEVFDDRELPPLIDVAVTPGAGAVRVSW